MRKQWIFFLNSEQKIIYAKKRVNNFLNNAEQKIILCRMLEIVYEKTVNNFLNSEQKIIYAEKRVNNFLNNVEQKIILCIMLETVYAKNNEQFLWESGEHGVQRANFINVKTDFINAKK